MFVVAAGGGTPRQVQPQFLSAHHPIWSPDGKHLLFMGRPASSRPAREDLDWWVTPAAGGQPVKTGTHAEFRRLGLSPPVWPRVPLTPSHWSQDYLLFSRLSKDSTNLWTLPFSSRTFRIAGQAQRLTFGVGLEVNATISPSRDIVFADVRENYEIWSLPIDADRGLIKGPLQRMTHNAGIDRWPSISRDGRKLVYLSFRSGNPEVWLKELDSGRETPLTSDGAAKDWPEIAPDGASYYFTRTGQPAAVWWATLHDTPKHLCADCQTLTPLPEGTGFLHTNLSTPIHPHLMDSRGRSTSWLRHPTWNLHQPQLSPDGAWVVFYASLSPETTRIYVARFGTGAAPPLAEWTAITGDQFVETTPLWSPDGNRLYFSSNRDGFPCIWSVPLVPVSKRPVGPPVPVAHFHNATQRMGNVGLTRRGMSVARDRIVFPLVERTGNLWVMRSPLTP
jgi:Tol biopolymer transport system component